MECDKIPKLIELDEYDGDYLQYENAVYSAYENTFGSKNYFLDGRKIAHKQHPKFKDKSATFWHIISNGPDEENRLPDLRRYERVTWPAFILDYCISKCTNLLRWENIRKGKKRILLWCKDIDYLVILDNRESYYIFWTAYPVVYGHTRKKLQAEYDSYINGFKNA